jgi:hypothetical protein
MSAAAFALRDGRRVEIAPMRCIRWASLFRDRVLDPEAYEQIPARFLPAGVDMAYFAVTYFTMALPDSFFEAAAGTMPDDFRGQEMAVPVRAEPFFALDANGHFAPITNGQAVGWLLELYPSETPTESRFVSIPAPSLPPGVVVAWFDAYAFQASMPGWARDLAPAPAPAPARRRRARANRPTPPTDTRPLMTPKWCVDNADEYGRRYGAYPDECPICLRENVECYGPIHGILGRCIPTRCTHMACCPCWSAISSGDRKCPFCRDDVSDWLLVGFPALFERVRATYPRYL